MKLGELFFFLGAIRAEESAPNEIQQNEVLPNEPMEYRIKIELPSEWGVNEVIQHQIKTSTFTSKYLTIKNNYTNYFHPFSAKTCKTFFLLEKKLILYYLPLTFL